MYLENIYSPADVKKLSFKELNDLSNEIRASLLQKLSEHGGHFGPNFGMVEATIALHYVFNSPEDKIVFDVSHQSYVHKMLTGRKDAFLYPAEYDNVSGYSEPQESKHDFFVIGHTSTSVSLASGLAKGRDLIGGNENIIAVIGDGSLSGGEAFEGLDYMAELGTNMIIIVNDNQMSIAENHGGLYKNLKELRDSNGQCECNFFKAMGLDYIYVNDGNDVQALIEAFSKVKDIQHPIVVHINTLKGKGYARAEQDKETYHWRTPFNPRASTHRSDDYCEGTAWQWTWFVPHDVEGLVNLMGGEDAFVQKLDSLFSADSSLEGETTSSDISGLIGQYAHGNEPSHHVIHLYNYVNHPWRTQELVDSVYRSQYTNSIDGLSGNEDCGQMSAWYILNSMGFYQVCPGKPVYSIGRPAFDKAVINLPEGKTFSIVVKNNGKKNKYIESVLLNGKALNIPFFNHQDIANGGTMEIKMTDHPTKWGVLSPALSSKEEE